MTTTKLFFNFKPHNLYFSPFPKPKLSLSKPFSTTTAATAVKMSSSSQLVEHIVLFNVKPDTDPTRIDQMLTNLNNLKTLQQVVHVTAGALVRTRSSPFPFSHILHSRYHSVKDLEDYSAHPRHVSVVSEFVRPVCDDILAFDWVAKDLPGPIRVRPGSGIRVNLLKLKEGVGESERNEILGVIGGIKDKFPGIEQLSFGENFSPARAKGFSIGSIAVVPGLEELEGLDSEGANEEKEKVRGFIESVIVLDYLVPQVQNASL